MAGELLQPRHDAVEETRVLAGRKRQKFYYDRGAKQLPEIKTGETVRVRLPDEKWSRGTSMENIRNWSYMVKVENNEYQLNGQHLLKTNEPPQEKSEPDTDFESVSQPVQQGQPVVTANPP